jgi:hypothetical protein
MSGVGPGRDFHGFCGFVVVLKFLIFAVVIFFMTLSLLFNLDVIFTTGIKVAVVIKQAFVFLIDMYLQPRRSRATYCWKRLSNSISLRTPSSLSAGGVTPSSPLIETKNPQAN